MITEQALAKIAEYGLLGALLIIAGCVIIHLYKSKEKATEARFQDMKEVLKADAKFHTEIKILLDRVIDILQGSRK